MKIELQSDMHEGIADFPMPMSALQDLMREMQIPPESPKVVFTIIKPTRADWLDPICHRQYRADIRAVNQFAERAAGMTAAEKAAFEAVTWHFEEMSFDEVLDAAYGLESVEIWSCRDEVELVRIVLENGLIPDYAGKSAEELSDEDYLIIPDKLCNRMGYLLTEGYLCHAATYRRPETHISFCEDTASETVEDMPSEPTQMGEVT